VADVTLSAGGPAVTDQGEAVLLGYDDLVVGSTTIQLPSSLQYTPPPSVSSPVSAMISPTDSSMSGASITSVSQSGPSNSATLTTSASASCIGDDGLDCGSTGSQLPSDTVSVTSGSQIVPTDTQSSSAVDSAQSSALSSQTGTTSGAVQSTLMTSQLPSSGSNSTMTSLTGVTPSQPVSITSFTSTASGSSATQQPIITVTDAAGSTIVGTHTTMTDAPNLSTTTLSNPAWTGNTVTTTSTEGGGPTVVPILFVGGAYIGLLGLGAEMGADASLLSVFPFAGLPAFSLEADGQPEIESDENQPSNQPSETQPSETQPSQTSQLTSSNPSSSSTMSSTSSCSASSCNFCATYDYNPMATPDPINFNNESSNAKRALAGRFYLKERARSRATKTNVVASRQCPVSTYTIKPDYPGPGDVGNNEGANNAKFAPFYATATYWAVPTVSYLPFADFYQRCTGPFHVYAMNACNEAVRMSPSPRAVYL